MINWIQHKFSKVVPAFPDPDPINKKNYVILDLSGNEQDGVDTKNLSSGSIWNIGKYDEQRNIYQTELFTSEGRNLHVGLDIGGPVGTAVHTFMHGKIHSCGYNPKEGDYGNVIVTEHILDGVKFWALFGHLDSQSSQMWKKGDIFEENKILGYFGDRHENGNWPPHLHLQLSLVEPETHDLPGAVVASQRDEALKLYPDPQLITGRFY